MPVVRSNAIGSEPIGWPCAIGSGQSWLVGYGLRAVPHVEPGQSGLLVHGWSIMVPPSQTIRSELPAVHGMLLFGPPRHWAAAPHVEVGQSGSVVQGRPMLAPPTHTLVQIGHGWMPGTFGRSGVAPFRRSASRKMSELSGRLRLESPVVHSVVPTAFCAISLITQVLRADA